jgi:hypothetical protein
MSAITFHAPKPRCAAGKPSRLLWRFALPLLLGARAVQAADSGTVGEIDEGRSAAPPLSRATAAAPAWRVSQSALPALLGAGSGGLPGASATRVVQTMAWTARPALQLGLGIEKRWTSPGVVGTLAPTAAGAGLLVGLRLDAGPRAHLTVAAPLWRPDTPYGDSQTRQMRVGLALTPQDPYADLRRGLLTKIELSGQTTLAVRPRGRRIGLLLTSHW